jgi:hypothetical protein
MPASPFYTLREGHVATEIPKAEPLHPCRSFSD